KPAPARDSGWRKWFDVAPEPPPPAVEQTDDLVAVKCNLCAQTALNPPGASALAYSCEENCPTGALLRVDPRVYFAEIRNIEGLIFKDSTHPIPSPAPPHFAQRPGQTRRARRRTRRHIDFNRSGCDGRDPLRA